MILEIADMTARRKLWLGSALLYGLFVSWYTDFGGPLTETEIQGFIAKTCLLYTSDAADE